MSYLLLDDGFAENKKVAALTAKAFKFHVTGLCYCARNLTDGHVNSHAIRIISSISRTRSTKLLAELTAVKLWKVDPKGDGFWINDYLVYNPTAKQVKARKEAASRAAKSRWGTAGNPVESDAERNAERNAERTAPGNAERNAKTHPIPSHNSSTSPPFTTPAPKNGHLDEQEHPQTPYFARLHTACGATEDALTKLKRAARGKPEAAIVVALEACTGAGVRSPLAVALAELGKAKRV